MVPRRYTDLALAQGARSAGMRAIVFKSHHESTVGRAAVAAEAAGFAVYGSLVLNPFVVGDISPDVVEASLDLGARIIWLPTLGAAAHATAFGRGGGGWRSHTRAAAEVPKHVRLTTLDPSDPATRRVIRAICRLIRRADAILASGHLSLRELAAIAVIAGGEHVRYLVTHPDYRVPGLGLEAQVALARELPGVIFERCAFASSPALTDAAPIAAVVAAIRATGPSRNIISSDLGQPASPPYPDGLATFASAIRTAGITATNVRSMLSSNPARLLGLA